MGLGDKLKSLLVEDVESDHEYNIPLDIEEEETEEVVVQNNEREHLIGDIYNNNNLGELDKSILKVQEVIASLPKELSAATKKATVISILSSFGLDVNCLVADGIERVDKLSSANHTINQDNSNKITEKKALIEEKSKEIESLEQEVYALEQDTELCSSMIEKEINVITELVKFIEGSEQ